MLPTRQLGKLRVSMQGLGCMGMSEFYGEADQKESFATLERAFEKGVNFFDTADAYGFGANEKLLQGFIAKHDRDQLIIATKCGIVRDKNDLAKREINNDPSYIVNCCEASLNRLGVSYIDLYYLHRINEKHDGQGAPLKDSMKAFAALLNDGKIHYVGISEATSEQIRRTNDYLLMYTNGKHGLTAVQSEYSLLTRNPEKDGVLAICKELGIGFVAYSPLSRQLLSGVIENADFEFAADDFRRNMPRFSGENIVNNISLIRTISAFAKKKGCSVAQLALAWVMAQGDYIVPIPGTKRIKYLEENIASSDIVLTEKDLHELDKIAPYGIAAGDRYTPASMKAFDLSE